MGRRAVRLRTSNQLPVCDRKIALSKSLPRHYVCPTMLFSVGLSYFAYAISSLFGAPNMKGIPVRAVRAIGLQGE